MNIYLAATFLTCSALSPIQAVDLYWDVNGAVTGSGGPSPNGTWGTSTSSNFTLDPGGQTGINLSTSISDIVHFSAGTDATGAYTVTLGGSREVAGIVFEEGIATLNPNSSSQTLTVASNGTITNSSGNQAWINVNLIGTTALNVLGSSNVSFARVSSSSAPFTMNIGTVGDGSQRIVRLGETSGTTASANNSNLNIVINSGTLLLDRDTTGNAAPNGVMANSGTLFAGTGIVGGTSGAVTIGSGATIQGGNGTTGTTLTVGGALTLADNSIVQLALGPGGSHSTLARTGSGTWTFDNNQAFNFTNVQAGSYNNIVTGLSSDPGTEGMWTVLNSGYMGTFTYDGANIDLTLTAVPEPSTWAAGFLAVAAVAYSQRRRFANKLKTAVTQPARRGRAFQR